MLKSNIHFYSGDVPPSVMKALVEIFHRAFLAMTQEMTQEHRANVLNLYTKQVVEYRYHDLQLTEETLEMIHTLCKSTYPLSL